MTPRIHEEACRLVRERKAPDYRAACSMIAKRRNNKNQQPVAAPVRPVRLPYADL